MSTSSTPTSFNSYARSAKEFILAHPANLSAVSNLILCTAVSGNLVHGVTCAILAFTVSKIARFIRKKLPSMGMPSGRNGNPSLDHVISVAAAAGIARFFILGPLAEAGISCKVHLFGAALIAAISAPILGFSAGFLFRYTGDFYDVVPFIP